MKAIALQDSFGISYLQPVEQVARLPAQGEVLVKLQAVSLNYVDFLVIKGLLNPHLPLPYIPVCDGAGIVEQVGAGVTAFQPGDKVAITFIALRAVLEQARQSIRDTKALAGIPEDIADIQDRIIPGLSGELPLRIYMPIGCIPSPIIKFVQGDGWIGGDLDTLDVPLRALANRC